MTDLLVISGEGMSPFSVRGITESLEPIDNPQFDKYRLVLTCTDIEAPAFDALKIGNWRRTVNGGLVLLSSNGSTVTVDCISELSYKTSGGSPARTVVPGSSRVSGSHTFYRPRLTVGLIRKSQETDEYGRIVSWVAEFEEI